MLSAPQNVQGLFTELLAVAELTEISDGAERLQGGYVGAGIVTERWLTDALHIALATVAGCALLVSWNFRHIVNFQRIPMYNAVNTLQGYGNIAIFSPQEVIADEDEDL